MTSRLTENKTDVFSDITPSLYLFEQVIFVPP